MLFFLNIEKLIMGKKLFEFNNYFPLYYNEFPSRNN
jgi:hypothetical protein